MPITITREANDFYSMEYEEASTHENKLDVLKISNISREESIQINRGSIFNSNSLIRNLVNPISNLLGHLKGSWRV